MTIKRLIEVLNLKYFKSLTDETGAKDTPIRDTKDFLKSIGFTAFSTKLFYYIDRTDEETGEKITTFATGEVKYYNPESKQFATGLKYVSLERDETGKELATEDILLSSFFFKYSNDIEAWNKKKQEEEKKAREAEKKKKQEEAEAEKKQKQLDRDIEISKAKHEESKKQKQEASNKLKNLQKQKPESKPASSLIEKQKKHKQA